MSMFTRSDKPYEGGTGAKPQTPETPATPAEPARAAATAQPITKAAQPVARQGGTQVPGVSVISKALKITGQLESTEDIQIEGEIDGDVRGVAVKVGSNAKVKGTVFGEEVELAGSIDGKIEARKVVLTSTAHMSGDVVHQDIRIESGAFIDGHCRPEYDKVAGKTGSPKPASPSTDKPNGAAS